MDVLIAEDDLTTLTLLEASLEKLGYNVFTAENGEQAWEIFKKHHPPLVISDWIMPRTSGLELIQRIRLFKEDSYIYIILLSGKSETEDIVEGLEAGADDFIVKPFATDELRCRIDAARRIIELEQNLFKQKLVLEDSNKRMAYQLASAAKIQQAFLPKIHPRSPGVQFEWIFKPTDELAGDFLNVIQLDETHIGIYVLDVSGHGVPAALQSVMLSRVLSPSLDSFSLLRKEIRKAPGYSILEPAEVAEELNKRFVWDQQTKQFFTIIYGILDLESLEFKYITAGHPAPILLSKQGVRIVHEEPSGPPISVCTDMKYTEYSLFLNPGNRLFLYTDGIIEAMNPEKKQYTRKRFLELLKNSQELNLREVLAKVTSEIEDWCQTRGIDDDISLLALEVGELKGTMGF